MSEVDDILSVANTEAPISCVVSRLTLPGPAAAGWEIEEVFRFLLIVTLLAGQSVGRRMTSSDVMTTMYNHQSVICLLGEFLGPSNQLQSCPDEPQTKQTDCISLIVIYSCAFLHSLKWSCKLVKWIWDVCLGQTGREMVWDETFSNPKYVTMPWRVHIHASPSPTTHPSTFQSLWRRFRETHRSCRQSSPARGPPHPPTSPTWRRRVWPARSTPPPRWGPSTNTSGQTSSQCPTSPSSKSRSTPYIAVTIHSSGLFN